MPSSSGAPSPGSPPSPDTERPTAWLGLAALLAGGSLMAALLPATALDWQPLLAWREPWRWWTAALVHGSPAHLGANLLALALVAALGVVAAAPRRLTLAWALAWPLTHLALLAQPALRHYGGLSGVLHAAVALLACHLLATRAPTPGRHRLVGVALAAGLLLKLGLEPPWGPLLQPAPLLGIHVVPWAHACGAAAGVLAWLLLARRPKA